MEQNAEQNDATTRSNALTGQPKSLSTGFHFAQQWFFRNLSGVSPF